MGGLCAVWRNIWRGRKNIAGVKLMLLLTYCKALCFMRAIARAIIVHLKPYYFPILSTLLKNNALKYGEFFPRKHRMACKFKEKGRRKHLTILSERVHYWTEITNKRISIHFSHLNWKHTLLVWTGWQVRRGSNWKVYGTDGLMVSMARPFGSVCTPSYRAFLHSQTHGKTLSKIKGKIN